MYADGFKNLMKILSKFLFPSNFVYKCNNKVQRKLGFNKYGIAETTNWCSIQI